MRKERGGVEFTTARDEDLYRLSDAKRCGQYLVPVVAQLPRPTSSADPQALLRARENRRCSSVSKVLMLFV